MSATFRNWSALGAIVTAAAAMSTLGGPVLSGLAGLVLVGWGSTLIVGAIAPDQRTRARPPNEQPAAPPSAEPAVLAEVKSWLGPEDAPSLIANGFVRRQFDAFVRWERVSPTTEENFEEIEVILSVDGERVAYASVFDVHNECAWGSKRADRYVYENNASCDLASLLKRDKYQARLMPATDFVYLGVESFPNSPTETECHGTLSRCRIVELARALRRANPAKWSSSRHWGLELGQAKLDSPAQEFDQRRAIIIGVKERIATQPLEDVVRDIVRSTKIKGVDLANYRNSDSAVLDPVSLVSNTRPH